MKKLKRLLSIMLTMAMVLAMNATVFATTTNNATDKENQVGPYTITIDGKTSGHTYEAYQIFSGEVSKSKAGATEGEKVQYTLSDIKWGSGIDTAKQNDLVNELKALLKITDATPTAKEIAEKLTETNKTDSDTAKKAADIFGKYLSTEKRSSTPDASDGKKYTIEVGAAGYYLIQDSSADLTTEGATKTDFILEVIGDQRVTTKDDTVTVDKKILDPTPTDNNTAGFGDNVTYQLTANVPDHSAYENYFFIMNDTLSPGLDFNNDVKVVIKHKDPTKEDTTLTRGGWNAQGVADSTGEYYVYEGGKTDYENLKPLSEGATATSKSFRIAFKNIKALTVGDQIIVTYSAKVNENAIIGENGNPNKADLTYSNDPNHSGYGDHKDNQPGIPAFKTEVPTGESPEIEVITFITQIEIYKTQNNEKPLQGAGFTLTGISEETVLKGGFKYTQDPTGNYYQLISPENGELYTTTAPTTEARMDEVKGEPDSSTGGYVVAEDDYTGTDVEVIDGVKYRPRKSDDTGTIYIKVEPNASNYVSTTIKFKQELIEEDSKTQKIVSKYAESDDGGKIVFTGLGSGRFTITETKTPAGFNTALPIEVVISGEVNKTATPWTYTWEVQSDNPNNIVLKPLTDKVNVDGTEKNRDNINDEYYVTIDNKSGSLLPSTGGIGTTIFYIVGGILVLGAAILLITKKRVSKEV